MRNRAFSQIWVLKAKVVFILFMTMGVWLPLSQANAAGTCSGIFSSLIVWFSARDFSLSL